MTNFKEELKRIGGDRLNPKKNLNEGNIKVIKADKIDYKVWRNMKYDLQKQFYELEKIGEDYGVFQNAQGTHKILKQIKKLIHKL
jgi:hypothetical protein